MLPSVTLQPNEVLASHNDSSKALELKADLSSPESFRYASTSDIAGRPNVSILEFIWTTTRIPTEGDVGAGVGAFVGSVGSTVGKGDGMNVGPAVGVQVGIGVLKVGAGEGAPVSPALTSNVGASVGVGVGRALTLLHIDIQNSLESSHGVSLPLGCREHPFVSNRGCSRLPV